MPIPWGAVLRIEDPPPEKCSLEHSFVMPGGTHLVLYAKKKKEGENLQVEHRIYGYVPLFTKIKHDKLIHRIFLPSKDQLFQEARASSEKLGGKVTNEDLQATMMQVLKTMEKYYFGNQRRSKLTLFINREFANED